MHVLPVRSAASLIRRVRFGDTRQYARYWPRCITQKTRYVSRFFGYLPPQGSDRLILNAVARIDE